MTTLGLEQWLWRMSRIYSLVVSRGLVIDGNPSPLPRADVAAWCEEHMPKRWRVRFSADGTRAAEFQFLREADKVLFALRWSEENALNGTSVPDVAAVYCDGLNTTATVASSLEHTRRR